MELLIDVLQIRETSGGKKYKSMTLKSGTQTWERVSAFSDHPDYAILVEGAKFEGEVVQNDKGYYNLKVNKVSKASPISKAMDKKNESIAKFQDNKERSMQLSAAQRDAVLIVTNFMNKLSTDQEIKNAINEWRDWFLSENERYGKLPF